MPETKTPPPRGGGILTRELKLRSTDKRPKHFPEAQIGRKQAGGKFGFSSTLVRNHMPKDTFSMEPCFETLRGVLGDAAECNAFLVWRLYPRDDGGADKTPVDPASGRKTTPNAAKDRGILTLDEPHYDSSVLCASE